MANQNQTGTTDCSSPWPGSLSVSRLAWGVVQTLINAMKLFQ